jgi:hypothetical protein
MIGLMAVVAAWPIPSMVLLLACREILIVRLARAGIPISFMLASLPGYPERRYSEAPAAVQAELAGVMKWYRIFLVNLLISIALSIFVAIPTLLAMRTAH